MLKILNNIGVIGAILAGITDLICVIIFVYGLKIDIKMQSMILFACINSIIGILINILLRYQGQRYAELENEDLCNRFYRKKAKENKKYISMEIWQVISAIKDIFIKGVFTSFTIFGVIYISIEGSKNAVQILITLATLTLFACFGLINMNSAYCRFYNKQIPYMELKLKEKGEQENGII